MSLEPRWVRTGGKGVVELHRTRNNVQHHGVLPDADHISIWVSEVDGYVHSLIRSVFGLELADVHAANGISNERLRIAMVVAEAHSLRVTIAWR